MIWNDLSWLQGCHTFGRRRERNRACHLSLGDTDELFAGALGRGVEVGLLDLTLEEAIFWNEPSGIISSQLPLLTWELVVISKNSP